MPTLKLDFVKRAHQRDASGRTVGGGELALRLTLSSEAKPGLDSINYVDPDSQDLDYVVSTVAGALAEHQCKTYGDLHDPDQVAAAARRLLDKLRTMAQGLQPAQEVNLDA